MKSVLVRRLVPLTGVILLSIALLVLHHQLKQYHYADIIDRLKQLPSGQLLLAMFLTALNYLVLPGYDALALKYIKRQLELRKTLFAAFISYAFSQNLGFALLTSGSVRYRLYSIWGLSTVEITQIVAFCGVSFWFGVFSLGALVLLLEPIAVPETLHLPFHSGFAIGLILLLVVGSYLFFALKRKDAIKIGSWSIAVPPPWISISQIAVSSFDWALAGAVAYVLLPAGSGVSYMEFLGIFLIAQIAGLISHVPGGLGVFESIVVLLLSDKVPAAASIGSVLAYRVIYYLIPLAVAAVMLGIHEILQRRESVRRLGRWFGEWTPELIPNILAFTTFVGGAILLFSGATPAVKGRISWLQDFLPLPIMEVSHFLGSFAGVLLLLLARGLQRRIDAAYHLTVILLATGITVSLLKGFDYEEAILLSIMLAALLPCREYFYRRSSLMKEAFTPGWISGIIIVLLCSVWLVFFSYKYVDYSRRIWWQFAISGDAPRSMRATVAAIGVALFFAARRLLQPASPEPSLPTPADLEKAGRIVCGSMKTSANLALLGDKELLFSESGNSCIMYGIQGGSWISMGDPVGPQEEWRELIWQFRSVCDLHDAWSVFYQVDRENLHLYLDQGFTLLKLGEDARVSLDSFSLDGASRKVFRHTINKLEKDGYPFEVIPRENVPALLPELKAVSDEWLRTKKTREKGFSLGFYDEQYLCNFPMGVVRKDGRILAFVNIWSSAQKEELSVDLMRYVEEAPNGVMDYLFLKMMLWGKAQGYMWFDLGMAPFSGFEKNELSPMWAKVGSFLFRYGEHFYNFQGLRQYKEKYDPVWESRYLASPGGLALPRILTNLASLISGGVKGVISK